jgi:ATP-dependent RNA helicase SUPV3L1/SUV3
VFGHVIKEGHLPTDWLAGQTAALDRTDGDIDTLMQRLSGVRIWSYIAARADWVRDSVHWQGKAREVEDKLSDVLHDRLTARFVDRRSTKLLRRLEDAEGTGLLSAVTRRGEVVVEGHPVGQLDGFRFVPDPLVVGDEKRLILRAARRALRDEIPRRVALVETAPDADLALTDDHTVTHGGAPIATMVRGDTMARPKVHVLDSEFLDGAQRERLRARLQTFVDGRIRSDLAPLFAATDAEAAPELRGLLHRLTEDLGVIAGVDEDSLAPAIRPKLRAIGVRPGRLALFVLGALKPRAAAMRARLWALAHGLPVPALPAAGAVSMPVRDDWPPGFASAMGWIDCGPVLLRLDVAERIAGELRYLTRGGAIVVPRDLGSRFSVSADQVPDILRRLGFRIVSVLGLEPEAYGPPAPPMLAQIRRRRPQRVAPSTRPVPAHGPFAALAALKR